MLASWNDAMNWRCFRGISFQPRQDGITLPWFHLFSSSVILGISLTVASPADFTTLIIEYASKRIFSLLTNCTGFAKSSLWYFTREPAAFLSIFSFGRYLSIFAKFLLLCDIDRRSKWNKGRKLSSWRLEKWRGWFKVPSSRTGFVREILFALNEM